MSTTFTYLGPFLELHAREMTTLEDTCNQPLTCPRPAEGFCMRCGKSAALRLQKRTSEVPSLDVLDREPNMVDVFSHLGWGNFSKGVVVRRLGPNKSRNPPRRFEWSDRLETVLDISSTPLMISEEMQWFQRAFAPELGFLRAQDFLVFEIRWGLVIWGG